MLSLQAWEWSRRSVAVSRPTWKRILEGRSGARQIETFETSDLPCKIACIVPRGDGTDGTFNPDQWMEPKEQRKVDPFIVYAMSAARQALDDANWKPSTPDEQYATGVMIGSGIGGVGGIAEGALLVKERGPRKLSPFFIPGRIINLASGYVSIEFGLKGPNSAVVTACSTGTHAIGDASRMIALGDADVMVGGRRGIADRSSVDGWLCGLPRACRPPTTTRPRRRRGPDDKDRDGFVMGEGAGARGARRIRARQEARREDLCRGDRLWHVGRCLSHHGADAGWRRRVPLHDGGDQAGRNFRRRYRLHQRPWHIDAWPTRSSLAAVERVVGNAAAKISMSSTKSSIGHLLGAAGAVEAIFSILAIRDQVAPPTINLDNPSVETPIDLVPHKAARTRDQGGAVEFIRLSAAPTPRWSCAPSDGLFHDNSRWGFTACRAHVLPRRSGDAWAGCNAFVRSTIFPLDRSSCHSRAIPACYRITLTLVSLRIVRTRYGVATWMADD